MNTDKEIYSIFRRWPGIIFLLAKLPFPGRCKLTSVTVKALQRTMDGLLIPADPTKPIVIVEVQFRRSKDVYNRLIVEMALIQQEHQFREVQGIIIFAKRGLDPRTRPWNQIVHTVVLKDVLDELEAHDPANPIVAAFKPVFVASNSVLEREARMHYHNIRENKKLSASHSSTLCEAFVSWLMQRLHDKTQNQIAMMLNFPGIENTRSGRDLIKMGKVEGKKEGLTQAVLKISSQKFGPLSSALAAKIRKLSADHVSELLENVLGMKSVRELEKWLTSKAKIKQ